MPLGETRPQGQNGRRQLVGCMEKKIAGCNEFWAESCKGIGNYFFPNIWLLNGWIQMNLNDLKPKFFKPSQI
jgi:hypothetical protein